MTTKVKDESLADIFSGFEETLEILANHDKQPDDTKSSNTSSKSKIAKIALKHNKVLEKLAKT